MTFGKLSQAWAQDQATINGWLSVGNALVAETMSLQGYDSLCIDLQHGMLDFKDAFSMLQALHGHAVVPLVRVPWLEPGIIMKALDAGALGIICPMVNTASDAARFASYARYPPIGQRSIGPTRAAIAYGPDYVTRANSSILAFAMIETAEGLENLEAIAATPGIDGLYIGPADLSFSLSGGSLVPGFDRQEPEMIEAIKHIATVCRNAGKVAALHCGTPEYAARAIDWGFRMLTVSGDFRLLAAAASDSVGRFRRLAGNKSSDAGR